MGSRYEISHVFPHAWKLPERFPLTDYLDGASARYIDPQLFYKYFSPEKAALAEALANRSGRDLSGFVRGGIKTKDKYLTINLKVAVTLGRERIR